MGPTGVTGAEGGAGVGVSAVEKGATAPWASGVSGAAAVGTGVAGMPPMVATRRPRAMASWLAVE